MGKLQQRSVQQLGPHGQVVFKYFVHFPLLVKNDKLLQDPTQLAIVVVQTKHNSLGRNLSQDTTRY